MTRPPTPTPNAGKQGLAPHGLPWETVRSKTIVFVQWCLGGCDAPSSARSAMLVLKIECACGVGEEGWRQNELQDTENPLQERTNTRENQLHALKHQDRGYELGAKGSPAYLTM